MAKWYKVLTADLHSAHGGDFDWSDYVNQPDKRTPFLKWTRMCLTGYHATTNPMEWPLVGMRVFEVVVDDDPVQVKDGKGVWRTMGLGRECPEVIPYWWHNVEQFVVGLPSIPWLQPQDEPNPEWCMLNEIDRKDITTLLMLSETAWFDMNARGWHEDLNAGWRRVRRATYLAARQADRDTAWWEAYKGAWRAAWRSVRSIRKKAQHVAPAAALDAALWATVLVCGGVSLAQECIDRTRARIDVWCRGYGPPYDVGGNELRVYDPRKLEEAGVL